MPTKLRFASPTILPDRSLDHLVEIRPPTRWRFESGPDIESFRHSKERPKFCEEAEPLDFSKSEELSAHRRAHLIEDLRELAPEGIAGEFDRLIAWYEHPGGAEQDRFRQASVRVGEFIERSCDGINIGGIRT